MFSPLIDEYFKFAILEDIGLGDITSNFIVPENTSVIANINCKEELVLAGIPYVKRFFQILSKQCFRDEKIEFTENFREGDSVSKGQVIARLIGNGRLILAGERVCLNILQRLSGIATMTRKFVDAVKGHPVKILDTRKTTPGLREMEKYAVRVGGGFNHRMALYDAILIKDNHIKIAGSVGEAIRRVKRSSVHHKIEVEVKNLAELEEAIHEGADIVMLDNMDIAEIEVAVKIAKGKALIEVSGGVSLENIKRIAETGVDYISIGALTHSAPSVDINLKIVEVL